MGFLSMLASGNIGGILTGREIDRQVKRGKIEISEYDSGNLNPNSYNLSCGNTVTVYTGLNVIDLDDPETFRQTETFEFDDINGFILRPGHIYLVPTAEVIHTNYFEPILTGRSSIGRLGVSVHQEAGFGDIGYKGVWTMQVKVTYPTKIYPGKKIAQMYFLTPHGDIGDLYNGKYQGSNTAITSRFGIDM